MPRRNLSTWVERLATYSESFQEIILKFLEGLDQTAIIPTVKELRKGLEAKKRKEREKLR